MRAGLGQCVLSCLPEPSPTLLSPGRPSRMLNSPWEGRAHRWSHGPWRITWDRLGLRMAGVWAGNDPACLTSEDSLHWGVDGPRHPLPRA